MVRKASIALFIVCGIVVLVGCASTNASTGSSASSDARAGSSAASGSLSAPASSLSGTVTPSEPSPSIAAATSVLPESEWGALFATIGQDAVAFGQRVQTDLPVRAHVCWQGEGGGDPIWFEDAADIQALFNALASSGVKGEAETVTTDDYTSFMFEFSDGARYNIMFDSMAVQVAEGNTWKFYAVDPSPALASFADLAEAHTMASYR